VPGGLATVSCPTGGSITVAGAIAESLAALLRDAAADGVRLCGGGYRDPEAQIQLRMAHCGTSNYAIYEMPASQCDPPTAKPGFSQHELGLAIDFTCNGGGTVTRSSSCFSWLSAHAADYGFYNLPEEPWHWSTTGK
jgi:LAS superfamily LD-carboxypeptidase LdcB